MENNRSSKHFRLEELRPGIYAAIAKPGGGAVGNAGFVDLGGELLVFDTFNTQQASEDLRRMAEAISGTKVSWVVNSHWHGDHIRGNQTFKDCRVVSSERTYQKMKAAHPERIAQHQEGLEDFKQYVKTLEEQFEQNQEEELGLQIQFFHEMIRSVPTLELVLPQYTFQNALTIRGEKRTARLMTFGGAHSICDAFLYIPEAKVAFMADLLFVESHPSLFDDSDLPGWIRILKEVQQQYEIDVAVPGHGLVGSNEDLETLVNYLANLPKWAEESKKSEDFQLPEVYQDWKEPNVLDETLRVLKEKSHETE